MSERNEGFIKETVNVCLVIICMAIYRLATVFDKSCFLQIDWHPNKISLIGL